MKITADNKGEILIQPFQWKDWDALWQLRSYQLLEQGITIDNIIPSQPDLNSPYEKDFHRLDQVYQKGKGNFWIARMGDLPIGHIGAQDMETHIELRRMYIRKEYRLLGVGSQLVQILIDHAGAANAEIIELWTAEHGPGRFLYKKFGFLEVEIIEAGERKNVTQENYEIRMRLFLSDG